MPSFSRVCQLYCHSKEPINDMGGSCDGRCVSGVGSTDINFTADHTLHFDDFADQPVAE
jgi:hypothetical protein